MNNENIDDICWDILDIYFQKGGSAESCNPLVKHQIQSYNPFETVQYQLLLYHLRLYHLILSLYLYFLFEIVVNYIL